MANKSQQILDEFDEFVEQYNETEIQKEDGDAALDKLESHIADGKELDDILPSLKARSDEMDEHVKDCDRNIKLFQGSKKMWNRRIDFFNKMLERFLKKTHQTAVKKDDIKLATSSRTVHVVDEEWLLGRYQDKADALQGTLPSFIKVSLSLDKRELIKYLTTDNTLMLDNPEKIHTETITSTKFK